MKINTLLSIILVFAFISAKAQSVIPNAGFENWTSMGSYNNPDNWGTLNDFTAPLGVYTCVKGTPGAVGTAYLKLSSKSVLGIGVVPAVAVSGEIDINNFTAASGFAFSDRPQSLTGKWQYMANGSDHGYIAVLLTKWNTANNTADTIAYMYYQLPGMVMSWANFTLPLTYISGNYPDSAMIAFSASGTSPVAGSYLYIDEIAFYGSVQGVKDHPHTSGIKIYPTPAKNTLNLDFNSMTLKSFSIQVFDITGKLLKKDEFSSERSSVSVDISGLPNGFYYLKLLSSGKTFVKSFIKE